MTLKPNLPYSECLAERKGAHIELAARAQTSSQDVDERFDYEPLFFHHPGPHETWSVTFLNHELSYPLWISSMTGGTGHARGINENLAKLCGKYKLGMGLGSCRSLLHGSERLGDFAVRSHLHSQPLFANLGIAQVEELVEAGDVVRIHDLVKGLEANGLIIHLNPLQEWFQPEGDRYKKSPLETLQRFLESCRYPVIVKEVGQGMGPRSLAALLELPIRAIELAGFGGTNFSLLESLRGQESEVMKPFINVGHSAKEMIGYLNTMDLQGKEFIISGGIRSVLDGYELKESLRAPAVIGMANAFLKPALESFETLEQHFLSLRESLLTARGILSVKGE